MYLRSCINISLPITLFIFNFLAFYADGADGWRKGIKETQSPKSSKVSLGWQREKETTDTPKRAPEKAIQQKKVAQQMEPLAPESKPSDEVQKPIPEKETPDIMLNKIKELVSFLERKFTSSKETKPAKQEKFKATAKKPVEKSKSTAKGIAQKEAIAFIATSRKDFTQVQQNWLHVCDDLEKYIPHLLEGVAKEDLPVAIKESKRLLDELRTAYVKQSDDELQFTVEKLNRLVKSVDDALPKAAVETQKNTQRFVEKSKKMITEMQKLITQRGKIKDEVDLPEEGLSGKKVKPFNPDEARKTKIDHGSHFVATLAKNPEKVTALLPPMPKDVNRLLHPEPGDKISPDQLYRMQHDPAVKHYLNAYLKAVESIGEHFFAIAKHNAPDYSSGTIVIEDKNGKIHEFLRGYVELVNKLKNGQAADVNKPSFIATAAAYGRVSSHFSQNYRYGSEQSKQAGKPPHYGIDLTEPIKVSTEEKPDPSDIRSHFLFGKIESDAPFMFIKFETHGLGNAKEAALHAINYIRRTGAMVIEKVQAKWADKKSGGIEKEESGKFKIMDRRENTPKTIVEEYSNLLNKSGLSKKDQKYLLGEAKARGVSAILKQIQGKSEFKALEDKIRKTYGDENLDIRMGNEIIIRDRELQQLGQARA